MFTFVLALAAEKKLLAGKTVAVDSTMLEANAAMKSIDRKDTGEDWKEYLRRLAEEAGIENPTDEDLRRFDKKRKDKKVSNDDWQSPIDPGQPHCQDERRHARIWPTRPSTWSILKTDLVLAAVVYEANRGDTETLAESVVQAQRNIIEADSPANIRRCGGRQRLSLGRDVGADERATRRADLHSRAQAELALEVERATGGATFGGDGQPPQGAR